MVQFNFSERTIKAKVVYYGPPQSGKTTNLEQIHRLTDPDGANRLISLNTAQDRTLFFDLLPFSLGRVSGYDFKIQLYTVPGQVQYNATRRVVLAGADAVVFVADSQKAMARENVTAFENMKVNLLANRLVPEKVPLVLQYNKRDLENLLTRQELSEAINPWDRKEFEAVAARGEGVLDTFVAVVQAMLASIASRYNLKEKGLDPAAVPEIVAQAFESLLEELPLSPEQPARPPESPSATEVPPPAAATAPSKRPTPQAPPAAPSPAVHAPARVTTAPAPASSAPRPTPPAPLSPSPPVKTPGVGASTAGPPLRAAPAAPAPAGSASAISPARVVFAQPPDAEPAYPGKAGSAGSPVSEELLHRAIRSNVELAETLGVLAREVHLGLGTILSNADQLMTGGSTGERAGVLIGGIRREATRLRQVIRDFGQASTGAQAPSSAATSSSRGTTPGAAEPHRGAAARTPPSGSHRPPAASAPASPRAPAPPVPAAISLGGLVTEVVGTVRETLAARRVSVQSRIAPDQPLPRCSPNSLRRTLSALFQGLAPTVAEGSAFAVRSERKPVLLRGRDGRELRRDFLLVALTHSAGLGSTDQQRILKGSDHGRLGEAYRLAREMGGFLRFAPLPQNLLETRLFLPL